MLRPKVEKPEDLNPVETQEWLEALDQVIEEGGPGPGPLPPGKAGPRGEPERRPGGFVGQHALSEHHPAGG
jgi:hypothetical protein